MIKNLPLWRNQTINIKIMKEKPFIYCKRKPKGKIELFVFKEVVQIALVSVIYAIIDQNYIKIYIKGRKPLNVLRNLKQVRRMLGNPYFFRCNKNRWVNMYHVEWYNAFVSKEVKLIVPGVMVFTCSRRSSKAFINKFLKNR